MTEPVKHETVLDTQAMQLGRVYAQALIGSAQADGVVDQVIDQLGEIVDDVLAEHPSLRAVFASPRVDQDEKCRVIDSIFGDKVLVTLLRFLKVVAGRGRLAYLGEIRQAAEDLRNEMQGRVVAEVRTAHPLTDDLRQTVKEKLGGRLGKEIALKELVDPELIGGLVIRIGDTVIDSSVAGKLNNLSKVSRDGFARRLMAGAGSLTDE